MKYLVVLVLLMFSCKKEKIQVHKKVFSFNNYKEIVFKKKDTALISINNEYKKPECGSGIVISDKLEKDPFFKLELRKFIYKSLINEGNCNSIVFKGLYKRNSFSKAVKYIYCSETFSNYNIYENTDRWKESYLNLLLNCDDKTVSHILADDLLLSYVSDGLVAFWDEDHKTFKNLNYYTKKNKNNFYKLSLLVTYYNNNQKYKDVDRILKMVKNIKKENYDEESMRNLQIIIDEKKHISYEDYIELIFGGY